MHNESEEVNSTDTGERGVSRRDFLRGVSCVLAASLVGVASEEVSAESLKENPVFDPEVQREALDFVIRALSPQLDASSVALPHVIRAETVTDEEYNAMIGFDVGGKRTGFFYPPDKILLLSRSKLHNLVHEYVHYIQYNYLDLTNGTTNDVEDQAVRIQDAFRDSGLFAS